MEPKLLLALLNKYRDNTLTPEESILLENWYKELDKRSTLPQASDGSSGEELAESMLLEFRERLTKNTSSTTPVRKLNIFRQISRVAAVVAGIGLVVAAWLIFFHRSNKELEIAGTGTSQPEIKAPSANKAMLTLGDGSKIFLDSASNGTIALQGNINIVKSADGQIAYTGSPTDEISFNTLSLPKGSRPIKLLLADGSLVWLNTASSITYPTAFTGPERTISIEGEAYFEVAKNSKMPFRVRCDNVDITVLGTHFNVNSYDDEKDSRVTLLEGSVMVTSGNRTGMLKPGQQAQVTNADITIDKNADVQEVMAWKDGRFYFDGANIKTIMRQVEKWYNVEVEFKADIQDSFVANISRNENLSELLKVLQLTNLVHFKTEGNKITVMK